MVRVTAGPGQDRWKCWLRRRAEKLLELFGHGREELSLLLVGDRRILQLNGRWRGRDGVTDVLAFSQREGGAPADDLLGDVVICLPQARRQAAREGHSLKKELEVLLVHGVLHLFGYEHEGCSPRRARRMWQEQERLLRRLENR